MSKSLFWQKLKVYPNLWKSFCCQLKPGTVSLPHLSSHGPQYSWLSEPNTRYDPLRDFFKRHLLPSCPVSKQPVGPCLMIYSVQVLFRNMSIQSLMVLKWKSKDNQTGMFVEFPASAANTKLLDAPWSSCFNNQQLGSKVDPTHVKIITFGLKK